MISSLGVESEGLWFSFVSFFCPKVFVETAPEGMLSVSLVSPSLADLRRFFEELALASCLAARTRELCSLSC